MSAEYIEVMLGWFPYSEEEKQLLRTLLLRREPQSIEALRQFLTSKDVNALNKQFKSILFQNSGLHVAQPHINPSPSNPYVPAAVNPYVPSHNPQRTPLEIEIKPYVPVHLEKRSDPVHVPVHVPAPVPAPMPSHLTPLKQTIDVVDENSRHSAEKLKHNAIIDNSLLTLSQKKPFKAVEKGGLDSLKFDFLKEYQQTKEMTYEMRVKLTEISQKLVFSDFLKLRQLLEIDKLNLEEFFERAKLRIKTLYPGVNNPGFTVEQFVELLCGKAEVIPDRLGYIGLMFNFLDYNQNCLVEMDEIFQGFIMLGPGQYIDKIKAAFLALSSDVSLTLSEEAIYHYLEMTMRIHKIRDVCSDQGQNQKIFDAQITIDLAAKSLARKVFEILDKDDCKVIGVEEFILFYEKMKNNKKWEEFEQDNEFKNSLSVAKNLKIKRLNELKENREKAKVIAAEETKEKLVAHTMNLNALKEKLRLNEMKVSSAMIVYQKLMTSKALTIYKFQEFMNNLWKEEFLLDEIDKNSIKKDITAFYKILDTNKNGVLEWDELMGALIFLLKGGENEKIINTFKIFDEDGSESLTFKELFFCLRVIFNVLLYDKSIDALKKDSSETVAYSMATKCFNEKNVSIEEGIIDFNTFKSWYKSNI